MTLSFLNQDRRSPAPLKGRRRTALLVCLLFGFSVVGYALSRTGEGEQSARATLHWPGTPSSASRFPPAAPDEAAIASLLNDPLAQDALRRVLEADDEARYSPHPEWPAPEEDIHPSGGRRLRATAYYVVDHDSGEVLYARHANRPYPIASIAKLLGGLIYADTEQDPDEALSVLWEDQYFLQVTRSKLRLGGWYRAGDLLHQVLLSSDNRAMMALLRQTGLPLEVFRNAMNRRAKALGLVHTYLEEPTGLDPRDVSSAREVALLLEAALDHPRLHQVLTTKRHYYERLGDRPARIGAHATNRLAHEPSWEVIASKTGYTVMSGSCLVMKTRLNSGRLVTMAILGARGTNGRYPVAAAIRDTLEAHP